MSRPGIERVGQIPATPAHLAGIASGGLWQPARHLALVNRKLVAATVGTGSRRLLISMPPRHGKGLDMETPIPTPTGWARFGDLRPGDEVFGGDGRPCRVVALSPVWDLDCYEVTSDSGESVVADGAHEWLVSLEDRRGVHRHETAELARRGGKAPRVHAAALDLPERELPIDPYVLGVWLGDGTSADAAITAADADSRFLRSEIESAGFGTRPWSNGRTFGVIGLRPRLREMGLLGNKHVPGAYLRSSLEQRRALLQGLVDTDGHVAPDGQVEFCTTSERLRDAVSEVVRSLGVKAQVLEGRATLGGRDCGPKWRVMFYMGGAARMPRKAVRCRDASAPRRRHYLQRFTPVKRRPTRCIQVDSPDHLFLAGRAMLPTSNSWLISRYFPAWYLGMRPDHSVILTSYESDFAAGWGRQARDVLEGWGEALFGVKVNPASAASDRWDILGRFGGMRSVGMGGSLTGKGAHLLVVDDPVKGWLEAQSAAYRAKQWDFWTGTLRQRLEPGGIIVVLMTRWHEDDLGGRLVQAAKENELADQWEVLNLPAIAEPTAEDLAALATMDKVPEEWRDGLGRQAGEALWPTRYPATGGPDALDAIKASVTPFVFACVYQGRPRQREGETFKTFNWRYVPAPPAELKWERHWDLAATAAERGRSRASQGDPDWTCGVLMARDPEDGRTYVGDVRWCREEDLGTERFIRGTAEEDARRPGGMATRRIRVPQDPGAAGKSYAKNLAGRVLAGFNVVITTDTGDKEQRAAAFAAQQQANNVYLVEADWNGRYADELGSFPRGTHDDAVDASSSAYNALAGLEKNRKTRLLV